MKNKIKLVNDIFDKYDPCHVSPKVNIQYADEYHNISVRFVHTADKLGVKSALDDAMHTIYGETIPFIDYDAMLKDLKHAI